MEDAKKAGLCPPVDCLTRPAKFRYMNCRAMANQQYIPTDMEQIANVITHGLWILPSLAGIWWMKALSTNEQQEFAVTVYGLSIFFLFTVSTIFHSLAYTGRFRELKNMFHIGDRAAIYVFIAASYTPWLALKDFNRFGSIMLYVVWFAAVFGILYQYNYHEQCKWLETVLYVFIAVAPSVIVFEMKERSGLQELVLGGSVYMFGVIFFKCDGLIPFAHAIWHSFVIVGAIVHYIAVCKYLLGPGNGTPSEAIA